MAIPVGIVIIVVHLLHEHAPFQNVSKTREIFVVERAILVVLRIAFSVPPSRHPKTSSGDSGGTKPAAFVWQSRTWVWSCTRSTRHFACTAFHFRIPLTPPHHIGRICLPVAAHDDGRDTLSNLQSPLAKSPSLPRHSKSSSSSRQPILASGGVFFSTPNRRDGDLDDGDGGGPAAYGISCWSCCTCETQNASSVIWCTSCNHYTVGCLNALLVKGRVDESG